MAEKNSYPMLTSSSWWTIRKKFKQTLPGTVTSSYISSILGMQEISATNNVMPYLKQIKLIDQDGKTGERAKMWRDDIDYPQVCDDIRKEIYPQELLDIPTEDKESIKRWFSRTTGSGTSSIGKITSFYFLLCDKDPSKEPDVKKATTKKDNNPRKQTSNEGIKSTTEPAKKTPEKDTRQTRSENISPQYPAIPPININLQIHISSDASAEQIDKIFESMYKHIYSKKDDLNG